MQQPPLGQSVSVCCPAAAAAATAAAADETESTAALGARGVTFSPDRAAAPDRPWRRNAAATTAAAAAGADPVGAVTALAGPARWVLRTPYDALFGAARSQGASPQAAAVVAKAFAEVRPALVTGVGAEAGPSPIVVLFSDCPLLLAPCASIPTPAALRRGVPPVGPPGLRGLDVAAIAATAAASIAAAVSTTGAVDVLFVGGGGARGLRVPEHASLAVLGRATALAQRTAAHRSTAAAIERLLRGLTRRTAVLVLDSALPPAAASPARLAAVVARRSVEVAAAVGCLSCIEPAGPQAVADWCGSPSAAPPGLAVGRPAWDGAADAAAVRTAVCNVVCHLLTRAWGGATKAVPAAHVLAKERAARNRLLAQEAAERRGLGSDEIVALDATLVAGPG